jgi:hypothetical protein
MHTHAKAPSERRLSYGQGRNCCEADASGVAVGRERPPRHEDLQATTIVPEIGTHVHQMTPNDVVTRLHDVELCH